MTTPDREAARRPRREGNRRQEPFLPHREEAFAVAERVRAVRALLGDPRDGGNPGGAARGGEDGRGGVRGGVPDLAGGTGAIASRLAGVTLLDVDPVLLEVARAALGVPVVRADPGAPGWADGLPRFDAVVTGTAPRCFGLDRLGALCGEIRGLPRPGGAFADRVPDRAATAPAARSAATDRAADPAVAPGRATDQDQGPEPGPDPAVPPGAPPEAAPAAWREWRARRRVALAHPSPAEAARSRVEGASAAFHPPARRHAEALRRTGSRSAEVVWRRGDSAVVAARR